MQKIKFYAKSRIAALSAIALFNAHAVLAAPTTGPTFTDSTTAAAAAYCMAKHPAGTMGTYTPDGYEYSDASGSGGIVGAVRRNFVAGKEPKDGNAQTCNQACAQAASLAYPPNTSYPNATAKALTRKIGETIQADGIGDFASSAYLDKDTYLNKKAVSAIWGHPNNYIEGDVGQADLCCCHVVLQPNNNQADH